MDVRGRRVCMKISVNVVVALLLSVSMVLSAWALAQLPTIV